MGAAPYKRIATEEAFSTPEVLDGYRAILESEPAGDPGFTSLWGLFLGESAVGAEFVSRLQDLGERRLRDMDESGIAVQVVSLTAPGVQIFGDAATATALAAASNDRLAEAVRARPDRLAGLAAVAPQDPRAAAAELERGVRTLGLKGAIVNSHTRGEYLDDPRYWEIFEAAEALDVPIYLHPNTPSPAMIGPFVDLNLEGAIYGFAVETGLHMLRLIVNGVFDRFPGLRIVVGHLGEAIPFWLFRLDYMHRLIVSRSVKPLRKSPSECIRENFYVTTSGMAWEPAIMFVHSLLGADRVLYAMDYPYQFVPDEVRVTDGLPLSDLDKRKLYQLNAERVFSL